MSNAITYNNTPNSGGIFGTGFNELEYDKKDGSGRADVFEYFFYYGSGSGGGEIDGKGYDANYYNDGYIL